ncbi:CHAT domain-containing protein [Sandarakinorhabdus rubra]|uniref:CHAT domain-containing protein n=1 Tax=Sandarakinorhabdus rubra TaxID=2672568 RepID=UPI0013DA76B5|nr:CHAT domain-containing protein [Sandarakinorhabdus rubra]
MKNYINLLVSITPNGAGSFAVRASSSQGTGNASFKPPFQLSDVIGHAVGPTRWRSLGTVKPLPPGFATARDCGAALFEALFTGEVRDVLAATEAEARSLPDTGVRIRLAFDLGNPATAEVAALPWELMRRRNDDPLVVTMQTALVRALDVPKPIKPRPLIKPLRILMIRSNPEGTDALGLAREGELLVAALRRLPDIVVDDVAPVPSAIRDQLGQEDYHVVHYMGHGDYQADRGGMLLLENEQGAPVRVAGTTFAAWLKDEPLRLVFLNACETGTTPDGASAHPFCGVAAALIQSNAPAVVAMQFPISDAAAIEFARTFYTRIARGLPVDAAVAEGRKALFDDEANEWATPVLYLRPADGNLFDNAAPEPKRTVPHPEPMPPKTALEPAPEAQLASIVAPAPPGRRKFSFKTGFLSITGVCAALLVYSVFAGRVPSEPTPPDPQATEVEPAADTAEAEPASPPPAATEANTVADSTDPAADAFRAVPAEFWINEDPETFNWEKVAENLEGTVQEKVEAIARLAKQGYPEAEFVLSDIYLHGELGQLENAPEARRLLLRAAGKNLTVAQFFVGYNYCYGVDGFQTNLASAKQYLELASAGGNKRAPPLLAALANTGACPQ